MAKDHPKTTYDVLENFLRNLNIHVFHVNLIPMTIGGFHVVVNMHWLSLFEPKSNVVIKLFDYLYPKKKPLSSMEINPDEK